MIDANSERLSDYDREVIAMRGDGARLSDQEMLACCALGLSEEAAEVACAIDGRSMSDDVLTELGDVLWYATTAAHRLDRSLARILGDVETNSELSSYDESKDYARELMALAGSFAGVIKKWLFHDRPLIEGYAVRYLAEILECASRIATQLGHTLADAQAANVAKLRKRFPSGGFTAAEANARADEARTKAEHG